MKSSEVMIQIRHVPESVHRMLKTRAAAAGTTLSDYLLGLVKREIERPTREELIKRILSRPPVKSKLNAADIIRKARGR
jgi:antitoxin FitA